MLLSGHRTFITLSGWGALLIWKDMSAGEGLYAGVNLPLKGHLSLTHAGILGQISSGLFWKRNRHVLLYVKHISFTP